MSMPDFVQWLGEYKKIGTFGFGQGAPPNRLAAGLWHEKFGTPWAPNEERRPGRPPNYKYGAKSLEWVKPLKWPVGDETQIKSYAARIESLAATRGGIVFDADILDLSQFVTGVGMQHPIENGFAWHRTLSAPYLPGSGVKGVTLAYARDWEDVCAKLLRRVFGTAQDDTSKGQDERQEREAFAGAVAFLDAVPVNPPTLAAQIMTPHGKGEGAPEDAAAPKPIGFLAVKSGTFRFALLPNPHGEASARGRALEHCAEAREWLQGALAQIGAGAKTKSGYGRFGNFRPPPGQGAKRSATTL